MSDDSRRGLHRLALDHVAGWPPEEAARWLTDQRLLALADEPETPDPLAAALRPPLLASTAANLRWIVRFREVADLLDGVPVCALKGIHLLGTVYAANPGTRPIGDLDLLVPTAARGEAAARLERAGLREVPGMQVLRGWHDSCFCRGDMIVDLHTRLGIKHGARSGWDDVAPVPAELHGRAVHVLDAETTLVHLLAHFVKHVPFTSLGWADDLLLWARRGFDAERTLAVARRLGAASSVAAGLSALRAVLGPQALAPLAASPGAVGGALVRLNERLVWRHLPDRPLTAPGVATPLRRNVSAHLLADSPGAAFAFAVAKLRELSARRRVSS